MRNAFLPGPLYKILLLFGKNLHSSKIVLGRFFRGLSPVSNILVCNTKSAGSPILFNRVTVAVL